MVCRAERVAIFALTLQYTSSNFTGVLSSSGNNDSARFIRQEKYHYPFNDFSSWAFCFLTTIFAWQSLGFLRRIFSGAGYAPMIGLPSRSPHHDFASSVSCTDHNAPSVKKNHIILE